MRARFPSLKWRLIRQLFALQALTILSLGAAFVLGLWSMGFVGVTAPDEETISAVASSLEWNGAGIMHLRGTDMLDNERKTAPGFWFIVRDREGRLLSDGPVPLQFTAIASLENGIAEARFNGDPNDPGAFAARLRVVESDHGPLTIIVGRRGILPPGRLLLLLTAFASSAVFPAILLTGLITLAVTPFVAKGIARNLETVARAAARIDAEHRDYRLPLDTVPAEIAPLVVAMNETLSRLEQAYQRQKRFMLSAAHELRTPIAILQTRLETSTRSEATDRLLEDVARLATLAEQLLDLQRLNSGAASLQPVDLEALARRQAGELAPLIISAGYEPGLQVVSKPKMILGDPPSIERAIANLVQNAIQHGGRRGSIIITVQEPACISVSDEGPGVPPPDRERIFEPFQRLGTHYQGVGLGLHLVRDIVEFHGGRVWASDGPRGGARFDISFPQA